MNRLFSPSAPASARRAGWASDLVWATLFCLAGALFFYRDIIGSGFNLVFGDDGDARLAMMLMEHWHQVFSGRAAFFSPIFFYPERGVIGFTDANFLFGLVFALGRWAGLGLYDAFQLVVMTWGVIGYAAMAWLTRHVLGCTLPVCLLWAHLFAFSNLNALQVGHMQLLVVALVPLFLGCLLLIWRGWLARQPLNLRAGSALAILYPLAAFTGFYVCWFLALFVASVVVMGSIVLLCRDRDQLHAMVATSWRDRIRVLGLGVVAVLASVPFVVAYGPQLLQNNGFTVDPLFLSTFPHLRDLINLGTENLVWGGLLSWLIPDLFSRLGGYELAMGMAPGFLVMFGAASVATLVSAWRRADFLPAVVVCCVWLGWLMIVNVDGHSAWWLVRRVVPGARSIRVVSRYEVVLYAAALAASAPAASALAVRLRAGGWAAAAAVAGFLVLEQVQPTFARVSKAAEIARLDPVQAPPSACRFFMLAPAQTVGDHDAAIRRAQVDAIYQAMRYGVPTINGLSSLNPPGYWFYDLASPDYALEAGEWLARFRLTEGACVLDGTRWASLTVDPGPLPAGTNLLDLPKSERNAASGMRLSESGFAGGLPDPWSGRDSHWRFTSPQRWAALRLRVAVVNPSGSDVVLSVNGTPVRTEHLRPGITEFVQTLDALLAEVELRSSTFRPSEDGVSNDTRDLGVLVTWLSLEPAL